MEEVKVTLITLAAVEEHTGALLKPVTAVQLRVPKVTPADEGNVKKMLVPSPILCVTVSVNVYDVSWFITLLLTLVDTLKTAIA